MQDEFIILVDGELKTYYNFKDIPLSFDNVIKFAPYYPPEPHTHDQHKEIATWNDKLHILLGRENG